MASSDEDHDRSRRPGAEDRGWLHWLGTGWMYDQEVRVTPCVICTVHKETWSVDFLIEPQNHGQWFVSDLATKSLGQFSVIKPQNWW
jgi:hypothetical protein